MSALNCSTGTTNSNIPTLEANILQRTQRQPHTISTHAPFPPLPYLALIYLLLSTNPHSHSFYLKALHTRPNGHSLCLFSPFLPASANDFRPAPRDLDSLQTWS